MTTTILLPTVLMQTSVRSPFIGSVGEIYNMSKNHGRRGAENMTQAYQATFLVFWLVKNYPESIYASMP